MSLVVKSSSREFPPVSEGIHQIVLAAIIDLGLQTVEFGGKREVKDQLLFVYVSDEADEEGQPKLLIKKFNKTLSSKPKESNLFKEIKGLTRTAPPEEMDVMQLIGTQATAVIAHSDSPTTGKTYANVAQFMTKKGPDVVIPPDWKVPEGLAKKANTTGVPQSPITDSDIPF